MATTPEDTESAPTEADEAKERYRQALEAKKAKGNQAGNNAGQDVKGAKGSSSRVGGQREFRRKSG
ncbi:MAG: DUF5302 domain-containing protein [Candidatus Nanopelagicales bacterium]